jgi:hypothetical protein
MSLTQKINQTQLEEKDPDAENLLGRELGANPDALYILAQTVLVQNIALDQAKAQVAQLQQQLQQVQQSRQQPAHTTSFLGKLLGERDPQAQPPQPPPFQPMQQYAPPPPPPQYAPQGQWQQPAQQYVPVQSGQPSFLRGAMQTAAGVAAGALAFEGVESVLHGLGGHGGGYGWGGGGMMGGGFDRPVEETVINNYYDEPGHGGEHHGLEGGAQGFSDAGRDDRGDNLSGFEDSKDDSSRDDDLNADSGSGDASGFDDSSQDDGGGLDDGGGFDGGDSLS